MPGVIALWNVDKSDFKCNLDLGCMLVVGMKKVIAKEKETNLCVWHVPDKKEDVFVKIFTVGRRVPEGGQGVMLHLSDMFASVPESY